MLHSFCRFICLTLLVLHKTSRTDTNSNDPPHQCAFLFVPTDEFATNTFFFFFRYIWCVKLLGCMVYSENVNGKDDVMGNRPSTVNHLHEALRRNNQKLVRHIINTSDLDLNTKVTNGQNFRPSAAVSRDGLLQSCTCSRRRGPPPPPGGPPLGTGAGRGR